MKWTGNNESQARVYSHRVAGGHSDHRHPGGVRDLSVVRPLGFHFFAAEVLVSHAYVHLVDFGKPVSVGGVTVKSGDLLQGDEHGVIQVPASVAKLVGQACYDVFKSERALIEFCQTPGVTLEKMIEFVSNR